MNFKWNEEQDLSRRIWDTSGTGCEIYVNVKMSLKEKLRNPGQVRSSDYLADIGIAIAQIMDYIEKKENGG